MVQFFLSALYQVLLNTKFVLVRLLDFTILLGHLGKKSARNFWQIIVNSILYYNVRTPIE